MRVTPIAIAAALLAGGCNSAGEPAPEPSASPSVAAAPADDAGCAPAPTLAPAPGSPATHEALGPIEASFATAYRKACTDRLFAKAPLVPADAPHPDTLFVRDAPDANVASIYPDEAGDMVLETPPQAPSADELYEAIYCAAVGASEAEQETSGRCLPD